MEVSYTLFNAALQDKHGRAAGGAVCLAGVDKRSVQIPAAGAERFNVVLNVPPAQGRSKL